MYFNAFMTGVKPTAGGQTYVCHMPSVTADNHKSPTMISLGR